MKTLYASRITLLMDVLVEAVHKLVNYAFLCERFCALSPSRDRSSRILNLLPFFGTKLCFPLRLKTIIGIPL